MQEEGGKPCSRQKPARGVPSGTHRRPKPSQQAESESCVVSFGASRATKRRQRAKGAVPFSLEISHIAGVIRVVEGAATPYG